MFALTYRYQGWEVQERKCQPLLRASTASSRGIQKVEAMWKGIAPFSQPLENSSEPPRSTLIFSKVYHTFLPLLLTLETVWHVFVSRVGKSESLPGKFSFIFKIERCWFKILCGAGEQPQCLIDGGEPVALNYTAAPCWEFNPVFAVLAAE